MYNDHFGIEEKPFTMAPDPRYLYMSDGHREAFAHLLYGIQEDDGGFVLLTGEVGTGKTTVCRCLLEQLPDKTNVAMILNPKVTALELLASICDEFQISYPADTTSIKVLVDRINEFLLTAHSRSEKSVLIIDEAQNLSPEVLEQIRLLTNLETNKSKLLKIITIGQPELLDILAKPEMRQLAQRVTARCHLRPLTEDEIIPYVQHRLTVAGVKRQVFSNSAMKSLYRKSKGVPRLVNILCDRALLGAFVQGQDTVDEKILKEASKEVLWTESDTNKGMQRRHFMMAAAVAVVLVLTLFVFRETPQVASVPQPVAQAEKIQSITEPAKPLQSSEHIASVSVEESYPLTAIENNLPILDNLAWPEELPLSTSWDLAQHSLFSIWQETYDTTGEDACIQAEQLGLKCLYQNGGMGNLLSLNRPALLRMLNETNREFYITLINVQDDTATVNIAGVTAKVPMEEIALRWSGDYVLLWQFPEGYVDSIRPGRIGSEVDWLDRQMATIFDRPKSEEESFPFAGDLIQEVKRFQFDRGLTPDGIAGVQTLIHINSHVAGDELPKLIASRRELKR